MAKDKGTKKRKSPPDELSEPELVAPAHAKKVKRNIKPENDSATAESIETTETRELKRSNKKIHKDSPSTEHPKSSKKSKRPKVDKDPRSLSVEDEGSEDAEVVSQEIDHDDASDHEDDLTTKLLAGLESDDDNHQPTTGSYDSENPILRLDSAQAKQIQKLKKSNTSDEPGVVYIGRIPHGFYEAEMRAYFSQFGDIEKLRLSRNKKTGASKHYAFVEFKSKDVATIVAKTMNNYLMFGHILRVAVIPPTQVHPELFKGANRRFRVVPRNRLLARSLREGKNASTWNRRIEKEERRRQSKAEKLKELGYEFEATTLDSLLEPVAVKSIEAA